MTLILAVNGCESIWLLADRRLSYRDGVSSDDARKIMFLEATDGVAILGYAGLGATALGTEPSDWMSAVLRDRNLPLEQYLGVLAEAMKKEIPPHLLNLPGQGTPLHSILITALLNNEPRFYSIDLAFKSDRKSYDFRYTRHMINTGSTGKQMNRELGLAGSGGWFLNRNPKWVRDLRRMVRASDRGKVSPYIVADHLARLNYEVSSSIGDKSVGPSCIVGWRDRKEGIRNGGGAHMSYTGMIRDANTPCLPNIALGIDVAALVGAVMPIMFPRLEAMLAGKPAMEEESYADEISNVLGFLPNGPDENLR